MRRKQQAGSVIVEAVICAMLGIGVAGLLISINVCLTKQFRAVTTAREVAQVLAADSTAKLEYNLYAQSLVPVMLKNHGLAPSGWLVSVAVKNNYVTSTNINFVVVTLTNTNPITVVDTVGTTLKIVTPSVVGIAQLTVP
jgi:hypothetical protein